MGVGVGLVWGIGGSWRVGLCRGVSACASSTRNGTVKSVLNAWPKRCFRSRRFLGFDMGSIGSMGSTNIGVELWQMWQWLVRM